MSLYDSHFRAYLANLKVTLFNEAANFMLVYE